MRNRKLDEEDEGGANSIKLLDIGGLSVEAPWLSVQLRQVRGMLLV